MIPTRLCHAGRLVAALCLVAVGVLWAAPTTSAMSVYAAYGDSITMGYQVNSPWPSRLSGMIGQTVSNNGYGGKTTLWGLLSIEEILNRRHPTHMLIMFGTNDMNDPVSLQAAAQNVFDMARICRERYVVPIVATIPPWVGPRAGYNGRVRDFNRLLRNGAAANNYFLVDVGAAFGSGSGLMQSDGFHPNDAGQEVIAQAFFPRTSLPPLPGTATLTSPSGDLTTTRRPTFQWQSVSSATYYRVLVMRDGKTVVDEWTQSTSYQSPIDLSCASYTWYVMTHNESGNGRWSSGMEFRYNGPDCCFPDTLDDLREDYVGGGTIEYSWAEDACADDHHLYIQRDGKKWRDVWDPAGPQGGRDGIRVSGHRFGDYTFWVQATGVDGEGAWSDAYSFRYGMAEPETPAGTLTDRMPWFKWDDHASADATWYHIVVAREGVRYLDRWVPASETTGSNGNRYYQFSDVTFKYGNYKWWVRAHKADGSGPWPAGQRFSIPQETPGLSQPLSPDGVTADTRRPTFTWSTVNNATWYRFRLNHNGSPLADLWLEGTTAWTPAEDLAEGPYTWWIRTWNPDGSGPWSPAAQMQIPSLRPEASTPLSPSGTAGSRRPTFTWSAVDRATYYYLYISRDGTKYYPKWIKGDTTFTPTWDMASGGYTWWIQTYGDYGRGPWSSGVSFTVP